MNLENIIMFLSTSIILAYTPGPDNIFVLTQSILSGKKAGFKVILGMSTGIIVHTLIATFGIAVIFKTSMLAFNMLKVIGIAYLLFLAYKAFKSGESIINTDNDKKVSSLVLFRKGLIMNISNPKVSMFFMAFLPQFTDPSAGNITTQLIMLGFLFILVTIICFGSIAILAGLIGNWINKTEKRQIILNKLAGFVFISLALKLVLTKQAD